MAEAGAKVLNAQAVEFAKERGSRSTRARPVGPLPGADPSTDGTVVRGDPPPGCPARSSASRASATILLESASAAAETAHRPRRARRSRQAAAHRRDRTDALVVSRENLHDEARLRGPCTTLRRSRPVSSTAWARSARSAPASTPRTRTCGGVVRRAVQGRNQSSGHSTSSFPNHVDGPAGPDRRRRPCAPSPIHRVSGPPLPSWTLAAVV